VIISKPHHVSTVVQSTSCAACNSPVSAESASLCDVQIHTSRQLAAAMVHAYPHTPSYHLLERLAKDRGEPSMEQLADDTSVDGVQHAANWEQVEAYLQKITINNMHEYVPVLDRTH